MESRGGVTGGPTITDFLADFAKEGYHGTFRTRPEGRLECGECHEALDPGRVTLHSIRRVEGVSDPDDMAAIAALRCPECGARGTATFCVGTTCPPEDGLVLRALDNQRPSSHVSWRMTDGDQSLVRDTGWLRRPGGE